MRKDEIIILKILIDNQEIIKLFSYFGNKDFEKKVRELQYAIYNCVYKNIAVGTVDLGRINSIYSCKIIISNPRDGSIYLSILKENNSKELFPMNRNESYVITFNIDNLNLEEIYEFDNKKYIIESYAGTGVYIERREIND